MMRPEHVAARTLVLVSLGLKCVSAPAVAQPTPYCVAGGNWNTNGVMNKLGMPGGATDPNGSLVYEWGTITESNLVVLPTPCHNFTTPPIQCYDEVNDTIRDPVALGQWVDSHPGRFWIIANEPNIGQPGGDNLTPAQYARMFHQYYTLVHPRDPSAKFVIAALAGGGAQAVFDWYDQALASYRSQFGSPMPIDIWNEHPYTTPGRLAPDRLINEDILPFRNYLDTVEGGMYAGCPLWLTEFGVATWSVPLAPKYINEFMQQVCPRLEGLPAVERFFWFYGPWASWDLTFADVSLIGSNGQPTLLGTTYSGLANGYPNPLPPPAPSQEPFPRPPLEVTSDFAGSASPWEVLSGDWVLDGGGYRQTRLYGPCGTSAFLPYDYRDVQVEIDLKVNATTDNNPQNWGGITLRGGWIWDEPSYSHTWTYLVYLRKNGELGLFTRDDGTVRSIPNAVADTSFYHHIGITLIGSHVEVRLDGNKVIEWDDVNARRSTGMVYLRCCKSDTSFDNVVVTELRPGDLHLDGDVDLEDFGLFQVCLTGQNQPQVDPGCRRARMDADTDVDQDDLAKFVGCMSGPAIPALRDCAD